MTQLIVSLNENTIAADIKKAIRMLRGGADGKVFKNSAASKTMKAIKEMRNGDTVICQNMDEYLKLVSDEVQD